MAQATNRRGLFYQQLTAIEHAVIGTMDEIATAKAILAIVRAV